MARLSSSLKWGLAALTALTALTAGLVAVAQQPRVVNDALLKTGSKTGEEWVTYGANWAEQRFNSLNQINADNIGRLGVEWSYEIPSRANQLHQEATPLVFDGVIYSITPYSIVYAVDMKTHKEIWKSDPEVNTQVWSSRICCGVVNRGIALYEGKVIAPVVDGRIRALNAKTGEQLWITRVSPDDQAYTITMAPRVIKGGKVVVGVSGGEYAVRGFFSAFDVNTGKEAWKFYTTPGDPSKPQETPELEMAAKTWDKAHEWWKTGGGGGVWNGFAYDDVNDIVYVGTGQPGPWPDYHRGPGDNLFCNSIVAVRGATGKYVWHFQEVPADSWDYDSIADIMLLDLQIGGRTRQVVLHAPKSGFFYILDRVTGELLSAEPFTTVSWATGVDLKERKMLVNPGARYTTEALVTVNPGPSGGHVWQPWSYNPQTGLIYFPGTFGQGAGYQAAATYTPVPGGVSPQGRGAMNMGGGMGGGGGARGGGGAPAAPLQTIGPTTGPRGSVLYAWNPTTQKEAFRKAGGGAGPFAGGSLSTGGNLVFSSVNATLFAYRADNGEQVLNLNLGMNQMGPPISVMFEGKQYIVVAGAAAAGGGAGGAVRGAGGPGAAGGAGGKANLVFLALDGKATIP